MPDGAAEIHQVLLCDDDLLKSSAQIFIYWTKLLPNMEFVFRPSLFSLQMSISVKPSSTGPNVLYRTSALIVLWKVFITKKASKSSSILRVCSWGGVPLALQAAHQSLDALQLVHRVLHRGFGRRGPPGGSSCLVVAVVLQSRAGFPAAWFGGFGARVEAALQARREQAGALRQRHRELVRVEAEPRP